MAVAEAEEDIEETTDIKDIQVKDIEAAKDMEMRIWRTVMETQKQTTSTAIFPLIIQSSAVLHTASKQR